MTNFRFVLWLVINAVMALVLSACTAPCSVQLHEWTKQEQMQMADEQKRYLPPGSITLAELRDYAKLRNEVRGCQ